MKKLSKFAILIIAVMTISTLTGCCTQRRMVCYPNMTWDECYNYCRDNGYSGADWRGSASSRTGECCCEPCNIF